MTISRRRRCGWAKVGLALAFLVLTPPSASASTAEQAEPISRCPEQESVGADSDAPAQDLVKLSRDDPVRVAYDGKRGMTDTSFTVSASRPLQRDADMFAEVESDFERGDGGDTFPLEAITVDASVTRAGNVRVFLCLDADRPEHVESGRYLGAIRLAGSDVEPLAIPVEVSIKDQKWIAAAWIVLGIVFGLGLKTTTDWSTKGTQLSRAALRTFVRQPAPYLALLTGVVGAFISYTQLYEPNPAWGATADHVKLMLAGVAIQVTGMTATDLVSPYVPRRGEASRPAGGRDPGA